MDPFDANQQLAQNVNRRSSIISGDLKSALLVVAALIATHTAFLLWFSGREPVTAMHQDTMLPIEIRAQILEEVSRSSRESGEPELSIEEKMKILESLNNPLKDAENPPSEETVSE